MKIRMKQADGPGFTVLLPSWMIFSPALMRFVNHMGRKYVGDAAPNIPPEAIAALYREIKRANKRLGKWYFLEMRSADGDELTIRL